MEKRFSLRFQVFTFLFLTFFVSGIEQYLIANANGINDAKRAFALMWTPGIIAMILSLAFGYRLKDIGFKFGQWKYYGYAYIVPAIISLAILVALIITGLGEFELSPKAIEKYGGIQGALVKILVYGPTLGAAMGFLSGLGEEIGWRGFLHTKMIQLNIKHPFLIIGLIWAVWHWPLILFSDYATSDKPILSVTLFTIMIVGGSVFVGWIREKSGSVFTAAVFHGVHNLWIQGIYPAFLKKGPLDAYFGGESGVFAALFYSIIAFYIYKKHLTQGRTH